MITESGAVTGFRTPLNRSLEPNWNGDGTWKAGEISNLGRHKRHTRKNMAGPFSVLYQILLTKNSSTASSRLSAHASSVPETHTHISWALLAGHCWQPASPAQILNWRRYRMTLYVLCSRRGKWQRAPQKDLGNERKRKDAMGFVKRLRIERQEQMSYRKTSFQEI